MTRNKFLNVVISVMVLVSLTFGGNFTKASAQQRSSTPPQGKTKTQKPPTNPQLGQTPVQRRLTPDERKAAADRALALGQLPGVAASQLPKGVVLNGGPVSGGGIGGYTNPNLTVDASVTPHYFGPYANYANSPMPKGPITSITVDEGGSGYSLTPTVYVLDVYGTGLDAEATATVVGGIITDITVVNGGSDYTAPIVVIDDVSGTGAVATPVIGEGLGSLTGGIRKFVDSLPGLGPTGANNLGNYIPVATPDTTTFPGTDYYEIELGQYEQQLHSDLPPTTLRGYRQTNMGGTPFSYLGPTIVATSGRAVRIKFTNSLPTGADGDLYIPVDTTIMGAGEGPLTEAGAACDPEVDVCANYTDNRATLHLHGGLVPWISDGTPHQWITPAGEATPYPKGVSVSYVPDMWFDAAGNVVPAGTPGASNNPGDGSMTFYYNNEQGARLMFYHDHAYGITRLNVYAGEAAGYVITDAVEADLINGTNNTGVNPDNKQLLPGIGIPLVIQDKTFVDATTINAQDPTWRWGTGPIVEGRREPKTGDLWVSSVYMPIQNPNDPAGANAFGRWQYGPWFNPPTANLQNYPNENPYYDPNCDSGTTWCEPQFQPNVPSPSMGMESFNDTAMVNGAVYPYMEVDPTTVRFRILNAANDRFFNLHMYTADPGVVTADGRSNTEIAMVPAITTPGFPPLWPSDARAGGVPDPATAGPSWIQIGTEGGFLPAPVVIPPQPLTWQMNPGLFNVGNVLDHSLLLGCAERADVLVDFSAYAGQTLILYNDAPAAFPALDPRYDYYTGNPNQMTEGGTPSTQPGYGPNTRTVMQIRVRAVAEAPVFNLDLPGLQDAFAKDIATGKAGVFEASHPDEPIIVPQAAYNSAYDANFPTDALSQYVQIGDTAKTFTPIDASAPVTITFETKAMHDEMGAAYDTMFGRMNSMLGLDMPGANNVNQNILLYGYASPPVDIFKNSTTMTQIGAFDDGTQIWKIMHNGVDTHPIHFHLYNVQLINRVGWDGLLMPPEPNELGWKETIRVNPLEDTIVAMRPIATTQPFDIPNSIRPIDPTKPLGAPIEGGPQGNLTPDATAVTVLNHMINYGWEYVWHCHILSHEEMDMMHAQLFAVAPDAPSDLTASGVGGSVSLTWKDNSVNETQFTLQRTSNGVTTNIVVPLPLPGTGPTKGETINYTDTGLTPGQAYSYKVLATNVVGDTFNYNPGGVNYPTETVNSAASNTAANKLSVASIVRASANPTSASSVDFTVTFSQATALPVAGDFALTGTVVTPSITGIAGSGNTYTVTVDTGIGNGTLRLDLTNTALGGPYTSGEAYTVEKVGPSAAIAMASTSPTNTNGVNFNVTFDKAVTGVDASDFAIATTGTFSVAPAINSVTGTGSSYVVTVGGYKTNGGTVGLNLVDNDSIVDVALIPLGGTGAGNGDVTGPLYTIDNAGPTVVSSVRASASPAATATVDFTVTFSEAVTGVDRLDFSLTVTGGITGASVASVTGTGTTRTVTVNTGVGDNGTIRLNVLDNDSIVDAFFNPLNGLKTGTTYSAGQSYTIAKQLSVLSVNRVNSTPTNQSSVTFLVTFSRNVTGVDTTDFATAGIGDAFVTGVTPVTAARYNVTVNTGTGSGTLRLDVVDDNSITDGSALLGGPAAGDGNFSAGQSYDIDRTVPTVVSSVLASADPTNAATVYFTVTFSEAVTGVDTADFSVLNAGTTVSGASVVSVSGSGATRTVVVNTGTGSGTLRLDVVDNDSIADVATNVLGGTGAGNADYTTGAFYNIDKTPPTVLSITRLAGSPDPTNTATVNFTVTFSKVVVAVDAADFSVVNAGTTVTGAFVTAVSGTGATRTVTVNTGTDSGTLRLDLIDNDTIRDSLNNLLGGTGLVNGDFTSGQFFTIDKTPPVVTSIVRASADPAGTGTSITYTVTFSKVVTGVDALDFALTKTGAITGYSVTSVTGSGTTRTVIVNTGTGTGTLRLDLTDNDTIKDALLNSLGGTGTGNGDYTSGEVFTVVNLPPTVVSINRQAGATNPTNAASVNFTVTFSKTVTGVNAADFTVANAGTTFVGASITAVSGTGATRTVTVSTGTTPNSGTLRLDLIDDDTIRDATLVPLGGAGAGNGNFTTGEFFTLDKTPPTVLSIALASTNPVSGNNTPISFTVTFSEGVTGVNAGDFSLTVTGTIVNAQITAVNGTNGTATRTVVVNSGTGSGTIKLNVIDDDSIRDALTNRLGGTGNGNGNFTTGPAYNVR